MENASDELKGFVAALVAVVIIVFVAASCTVSLEQERTKKFQACAESGTSFESCVLLKEIVP